MRTKDQIIAATVIGHETACGGPDGYSEIIRTELAKRLTEQNYLTCEDFDHFDVNCCAACHREPHYQMIDVILDDGRHGWVCCAIRMILTRRAEQLPSPDAGGDELLDEESGMTPDSPGEQRLAASMAGKSDEERLYHWLEYAHRRAGRKRGHKRLETLVQRALIRPGRGPAKGCNTSNPPEKWGFCLQCGGSLYPENAIPGTYFHNCKAIRVDYEERKAESADDSPIGGSEEQRW
jgi:hypothetical protein